MVTIGIICPAAQGHLNTAIPIASLLKQRGHHVIFINPLDGEDRIREAGLEYQAIGRTLRPRGSVNKGLNQLGTLTGLTLLRYTLDMVAQSTEMALKELPGLVDERNIDIMIGDSASPGVGSVCEYKNIPYVTLSAAITSIPDPAQPPFFSSRGPSTTFYGRLLNRMGNAFVSMVVVRRISAIINNARKEWNMKPMSGASELSTQLHISQEPAALAFPRDNPLDYLHLLGPFHEGHAKKVSFPWERLDDNKPLVYASMGTIQNKVKEVFVTIAAACSDQDVQLVISLGNGLEPEGVGELAGNPVLVKYAPQLELLDRADVCITHGGANSVFECLCRAVPMVVLPVGNDQPAVAARVHYSGTGISLNTPRPTESVLREAVKAVLEEPKFKEKAQSVSTTIDPEAARNKAADLIEQLIEKHKNAA